MLNHPPPFASEDLLLVRKNRWILGLTLSPLLAAIGLALANLLLESVDASFAPQLAAIGVVLTFIAYRSNWWPSIEPVPARADMAGVRLGARFVPRARIRAGLAFPGAAPRLLLRRRFGLPIELQMGSHEEARSLLRSLGLDASQTEADFLAVSRVLAHPLAFLGAALAFFVAGYVGKLAGDHGGALGLALGAIPAFVVMAPTRVRVGMGGITLRWLWTERRLDLEEVEDVTRYEGEIWGVIGLRIQLRSGEVLVPMGVSMRGRAWGEVTTALVWERIREAMMAVERGRAAAEAAMVEPRTRVTIESPAGEDAEATGAASEEQDAPLEPRRHE